MYQVKVTIHNPLQKSREKKIHQVQFSCAEPQNHIALAMVTNDSVKPCRFTPNKAARFYGGRIALLLGKAELYLYSHIMHIMFHGGKCCTP